MGFSCGERAVYGGEPPLLRERDSMFEDRADHARLDHKTLGAEKKMKHYYINEVQAIISAV